MGNKEPKPLKTIRFERGITQCVLARDSGVFQSRISLIERQESGATWLEKMKLSLALDLEPEDILWPEMPEPPDNSIFAVKKKGMGGSK